MKALRDAVLNAGTFFVVADFDLWNEFCGSKLDSFVGRYNSLYSAFLAKKRKYFDSHYDACNKADRLARVDRKSRSGASLPGGSESEKTSETSIVERSTKFTEDSGCSPKGATLVDLIAAMDVGVTSTKTKKKVSKTDKGPGVAHKLKKSSTK